MCLRIFLLPVLLDLPEQLSDFRVIISLEYLSQVFDGGGFVTVQQVQLGQV